MGVMEMSHRGREFVAIYEQAEADLRELLAVPAQFKILFMQGGGLAENAIVPLNLAGRRSGAGSAGPIDVVVTGSWSQKSHKEAGKYGAARVAATAQADGFTTLPAPAIAALPPFRLERNMAFSHVASLPEAGVSVWRPDAPSPLVKRICSGRTTMGEITREYEARFADYIGTRYAVACNSGSSANLLMVAAWTLRYGKGTVIVPALLPPPTTITSLPR
jgi:hypothetical protein